MDGKKRLGSPSRASATGACAYPSRDGGEEVEDGAACKAVAEGDGPAARGEAGDLPRPSRVPGRLRVGVGVGVTLEDLAAVDVRCCGMPRGGVAVVLVVGLAAYICCGERLLAGLETFAFEAAEGASPSAASGGTPPSRSRGSPLGEADGPRRTGVLVLPPALGGSKLVVLVLAFRRLGVDEDVGPRKEAVKRSSGSFVAEGVTSVSAGRRESWRDCALLPAFWCDDALEPVPEPGRESVRAAAEVAERRLSEKFSSWIKAICPGN